ncbi:MAG: hypothetical protein QOJ84_4327 [Bradyrhizobium sp.]|jgi:hypothetical protein|nr:hypothetical protein [Bradyrhizobium sp.]
MLNPEDKPQLCSSLDRSGAPKRSVVAVVDNAPREVPRTLLFAFGRYQRDIAPGDHEVIVVDKDGSTGKGSHPWLC